MGSKRANRLRWLQPPSLLFVSPKPAGVGYIRAGSKAAWHSTHHTHGHVDSEGATVEMPLDHWETRAADKAMDPGVVAWVARVAGERDLRLPMVVDRCVIVGMVNSFVSLEGT